MKRVRNRWRRDRSISGLTTMILISATELTTYEIINYILYGLVNELVCLGCKEELAVTTLQMYAAYLRSHEIAFFGKRETNLPKMPFKYKLRFERLTREIPI